MTGVDTPTELHHPRTAFFLKASFLFAVFSSTSVHTADPRVIDSSLC